MSNERERALDDHFAEAQDAIEHIQGALRHRQQPQDVTFHRALKAIRDGRALLVSSHPPSCEAVKDAAARMRKLMRARGYHPELPNMPMDDLARAALDATPSCEMRKALEPFANVVLSSLYSDTDDEGYKAFLDHSAARDFTRQDVLRARATRDASPSECAVHRAAKMLLRYDGGEGSECYHAMRFFDARRALRAALDTNRTEEKS